MTDEDYLRECYVLASGHSDDPRTKNAAIIVLDDVIVGKGGNALPYHIAKSKNDEDRLCREKKGLFLIHAETNAIVSRVQANIYGATMYCPWSPCNECAKLIIQAGIRKVVAHKEMHEHANSAWGESIEMGIALLEEAGVEYVRLDGKIGDCVNICNGRLWYP
jgi:dCMP deaminase